MVERDKDSVEVFRLREVIGPWMSCAEKAVEELLAQDIS